MSIETSTETTAPIAPAQSSATRWILGLALVLRLLTLWSWIKQFGAAHLFANGLEMSLLARSILHGQGLASPFGPPTGPTAFIAPAYPILVAAVFRLFGIESAASACVMLTLHLAANLATIWLMMHLARRWFSPRAATIAGLFWAISPPTLFLPVIFWETSFSILLLLTLIALADTLCHSPTTPRWLATGAFVGFLGLVNPALLLTAFGLGFACVLRILRTRALTLPKVLQRTILCATTFLLVFCAWPIRNAMVFHAFVPLRTTVGFELWMGNRAGSTGFLDESIFPTFNPPELAQYIQLGEIAYTNQKTALGRAYIAAYPATFAQLTAKRFLRFWSGTGTQHGSPFFPLDAILTTAFALAGLILLFRSRRWDIFTLVLPPLLLFPIPYYLTHAEFRYRILLDPILTILGAYAITALMPQRIQIGEVEGRES
jgi:hypothetical protein